MASLRKTQSLSPAQTGPAVQNSNDYSDVYSNGVRFESTVFDLKLIFGQSSLASGKEVLEQHTAVTVPWPLVKLLIHFLEMQVEFHEAQNGKVLIPPTQFPHPLPYPPPGSEADAPGLQAAIKKANQMRRAFIEKEQGH